MTFKNILLILIGIAFLSIPVFAESGSITATNETTLNHYTFSKGTFSRPNNFSVFSFNNASYNTLSRYRITLADTTPFPDESNSTTFTCLANCSGSGYVYYSKTDKNITWNFADGFLITGGWIVVAYQDDIFKGWNQAGNIYDDYDGASMAIKPIGLANYDSTTRTHRATSSISGGTLWNHEVLFAGASSLINYNIVYSNGNYITTIDKSPATITPSYLATLIKLHSSTVNQFSESGFNKNNFTTLNPQLDGIYINVTLNGGGYNDVLINSSGVSLPPGGAGTNPVNITKPSIGGIVGFDKSSYFVGDNVNISWYFSDDTWNNFNGKRLYLLLNGNPISESLGCGSIDCIEISTQSGYYIFQATQLGTLQAILREGIFFYSDVLGGSASVQILPPGNSWIALNQTIAFAKNPVNVTYHIGYSVASYPPAVIEIDTIDIATGNTVDSVFPTVFSDGVINIGVIHPLPKGNYSIKLYDAVKNTYLDTKYLTMIVPNIQIPTQGITISNISTDKTLYFYNDWMTVNFAVDDTNFSNYNYTLMMHVIALDRAGIVTKMIISPMQDQVGTFTTLVNIDKNTKCEQKLNCWFETGNNSINIVLMNSTASVTIAYANFTVSSTTVDGYGLQSSTTTPQSNVQFTITTTVPTLHTGRLRIVVAGTAGNISAIPDQTVNAGISTFPTTISILNTLDKAYYNIELYGDDGIRKMVIPITVTQQVKPLTTSEINAMDKIDSWTALFGLGVNPTSKFIFGMMITLLIAACGVILVKNDRFIGAALFGAIPFLFFSYISYFPIVVPVIVGIIIALKFRFL